MIRAALVAALAVAAHAGCGDDPGDWRLQIGSVGPETSFGVVALSDGDVIVVASTEGDLGGPALGGRDVYIARWTSDGDTVWARQLGGPANDSPLGITLAEDGAIYVTGFTDGDYGGPHQGSADVWLARFDGDGQELWRTQFGTPEWDRGFDVAAVGDAVYVSGYSAGVLDSGTDRGGFDAFVARFDTDGNEQWIRQFGSDATDWGQGVAATAEGVYVTGYTEGELAGPHLGDRDAFVLFLDPTGERVWGRQFGSAALDWTQGAATTPDGGVLVAGSTEGDVAGASGGRDMLVAVFGPDGDERFVTQLGSAGLDAAFEIRQSDHEGEIVVTGATEGDLAGALGDRDAVVVWLDASGDLLRSEQFGSSAADEATGLAVLDDGTVVYSGYTAGAVPASGPGGEAATHAGANDILIGAFAPS